MFNQEGIRFWYDEGIIPGEEYNEKIATKISESELVICFLSKIILIANTVRTN